MAIFQQLFWLLLLATFLLEVESDLWQDTDYPNDVIFKFLQGEKNKDASNVKVMDNGKKSYVEKPLYRLKKFSIPVTYSGDNFILNIPLYFQHQAVDQAGPFVWHLYVLPKKVYKKLNYFGRSASSNSNLDSQLLWMYHVDSEGGAQIGLHVNPSKAAGGYKATIDYIHIFSEVESNLVLANGNILWPVKRFNFWKAVKNGNIKFTQVFSKALDTLWNTLGVSLLTCHDAAYFKCGGSVGFQNPGIQQLFIRIYGGPDQRNSLYMKDAFGFDVEDRSSDKDIAKRNIAKDRAEWNTMVKYLYDSTWDTVMTDLKKGINARLEYEIQKLKKDLQVIELKTKKKVPKDAQLALNQQVSLLETAKKTKGPKVVTQLEDIVKRMNTANTDATKRKSKTFPVFANSNLGSTKMESIMTMLWYRGNHPQCDDYQIVFLTLFTAGGLNAEDFWVCDYSEYCTKLTKVGLTVKHLIKPLALHKDRITLAKISPKNNYYDFARIAPAQNVYENVYDDDVSPLNSTIFTIDILVMIGLVICCLCICVTFGLFSGAFAYSQYNKLFQQKHYNENIA